MKDGLKNIIAIFKVVGFMGIMVLCFYSGMYVMGDHNAKQADTKAALLSAITESFTNTEDMPVIKIVPSYSTYEKMKNYFITPSERKVITIESNAALELLGYQKPIEKSWVSTSLSYTNEKASQAWNGIKNFSKWLVGFVK